MVLIDSEGSLVVSLVFFLHQFFLNRIHSRMVQQFFSMSIDVLHEEAAMAARRLEFSMYDLERVRDCIVDSFECAEAGQDLVVYTFDEYDPIKRIEVFLLQVLVPLLNFDRDLCKVA